MPRRAASFALTAAALAFSTGCGSKLHPVEGTVTFEGAPVDGATVTFISDDGKKTFGGQTDSSGKYSLLSGDKPGIAAGSYKVLVTKQKTHQGDMTPGSADYMKSMGQMTKETAKKEGGLFIPGATTGGIPVPKGELPQIYGSGTTTPFSATVPTSGPVNLDLKAEVKKK